MMMTDEEGSQLASPLLPPNGVDAVDDESPAARPTAPVEDRDDDDDRSAFRGRFLPRFGFAARPNAVVLSTFAVSVLMSFSIGLTVGIVPEILTDRYARIDRLDGGDDGVDGPLRPCWRYTSGTMPDSCTRGAVDAQTGSAYGTFVQNLLTFFFNAVIGSRSDEIGRRGPLIASVFLNALVPASLLAVELFENLNPVWFYASNAVTGLISFPSLIFATLADGCPEEHRAGRFARTMAGFYGGLAPTLGARMGHVAASWWSLGLGIAALLVSILFLPETVVEVTVVVANAPTTGDDSDDGAASDLASSSQRRCELRHHCERRDEEEQEAESDGLRTSSSASFPDDPPPRSRGEAFAAAMLRPLRETTILSRDGGLMLVAVASFLSAAVYSTDSSLVLFYIEENLNVREDDIASMFFLMGLLGAILQGIGLRPLVSFLGETRLLVLTFAVGTIHNLLYGIAVRKSEITVALSLSQVTKLNYPLLSSLASRRVGPTEQGRVQGALLGLNALAGAIGPVAMNWIYVQTRSGEHRHTGPGTMFVVASGLYLAGTFVACRIHAVFPASTATTTTALDDDDDEICDADESAGTGASSSEGSDEPGGIATI